MTVVILIVLFALFVIGLVKYTNWRTRQHNKKLAELVSQELKRLS